MSTYKDSELMKVWVDVWKDFDDTLEMINTPPVVMGIELSKIHNEAMRPE